MALNSFQTMKKLPRRRCRKESFDITYLQAHAICPAMQFVLDDAAVAQQYADAVVPVMKIKTPAQRKLRLGRLTVAGHLTVVPERWYPGPRSLFHLPRPRMDCHGRRAPFHRNVWDNAAGFHPDFCTTISRPVLRTVPHNRACLHNPATAGRTEKINADCTTLRRPGARKPASYPSVDAQHLSHRGRCLSSR
jgi:hypothetical protein